jgi:hypothetical protein
VHVAAAGAGIGYQRTVPAGQLPVPGLAGHGGQPGVQNGAVPDATKVHPGCAAAPATSRRSLAEAVQAGAHPGRGLHLEPHQLWLHPRFAVEHTHPL